MPHTQATPCLKPAGMNTWTPCSLSGPPLVPSCGSHTLQHCTPLSSTLAWIWSPSMALAPPCAKGVGTGLPFSGPLAPNPALLLPGPPSTPPWGGPAPQPWRGRRSTLPGLRQFYFFPPNIPKQHRGGKPNGPKLCPEKVLVPSSTGRIQDPGCGCHLLSSLPPGTGGGGCSGRPGLLPLSRAGRGHGSISQKARGWAARRRGRKGRCSSPLWPSGEGGCAGHRA